MTDQQLTGWAVLKRMKARDPPVIIALDMWVAVRGAIVRHARDRKRSWARELRYEHEHNALCVRYAQFTCHKCPARCQTRLNEFRHVHEDFVYDRAEVADLLRAVDVMINLFTGLVYHGQNEHLKCEEVHERIGTFGLSDGLDVAT